ncbi:hypothetical protein [Thiomicrorhabdus sp.]|uniref:hypothetical protein n=1 Tax=Thiomicrorhabdus sp. TaxID=2039724 RepID=UPI002AA65618|nr:hypothetical protein [Thiomicrorhabdus sp.]
MNNFVKMLLTIVVAVVIPLAVLLGIWAGILPQSLQVAIGLAGVALAAAFIIIGNLYLMYSDIKTGRYSK